MLLNAKSGACQEDCHYCSQSSISTAPIDRYGLLSPIKWSMGLAERHQPRPSGIVSSSAAAVRWTGKSPRFREPCGPSNRTIPIQVCCSLGLLNEAQAKELKAAGVDRINHNLNTSEAYHASICTTHTFQDRLNTIRNARAAGLEICSGGSWVWEKPTRT